MNTMEKLDLHAIIIIVQPTRKGDIWNGKEKQLQNSTLAIIKFKYEETL